MNCIYSYSHNGRILYVGKAKVFKGRHSQHKRSTETARMYKPYFDRLALEIGWENIESRILEQNIDENLLDSRERYYFNLLRPTAYEKRPKLTQEDIELDKQRYIWHKQEEECIKAMKT